MRVLRMADKCFFCSKLVDQKLIDRPLAFVVLDEFPVTLHHSLIVPTRHFESFFDITHDELLAVNNLIAIRKRQLLRLDPTIGGFNIGVNVGEIAGQSIGHVHIHLIPRRLGDIENPKGGVRGIIPHKRGYGNEPTESSKLVRDNIPAIMHLQNKSPQVEVVKNDGEYSFLLYKKLLEEVHEFIAAADNHIHAQEEIADILEVLDAICLLKKYDMNFVQEYKTNKKGERGGFQKRFLLKM